MLEAAIHGGVTPKGKPGGNIREVTTPPPALFPSSAPLAAPLLLVSGELCRRRPCRKG